MYYIYKILREIVGIFGRNNRLYKRLKTLVDEKRKSFPENVLKNIADANAYFVAYVNFKQHYGIEIPAECVGIGNKFEYVRVKLKDIKRRWDDKIYSLKQVSPYKYLKTGDKKIYEKYIKKHVDVGAVSKNGVWGVKRLDDLLKSIKKNGYDPTKSVICIDADNCIVDGQHRACCLLYLYGEDYEINVIKVSRD